MKNPMGTPMTTAPAVYGREDERQDAVLILSRRPGLSKEEVPKSNLTDSRDAGDDEINGD